MAESLGDPGISPGVPMSLGAEAEDELGGGGGGAGVSMMPPSAATVSKSIKFSVAVSFLSVFMIISPSKEVSFMRGTTSRRLLDTGAIPVI